VVPDISNRQEEINLVLAKTRKPPQKGEVVVTHLKARRSKSKLLLRKSLQAVDKKRWSILYFHYLVVSSGLACLWIPVFAGMTIKTMAGMGGS
jgi:hypothetical protein